MTTQFTCDGCGLVFNTTTTAEERDAESSALYGEHDEPTGHCCDTCWQKVLAYIAADPTRDERHAALAMMQATP